jgi:hypothetical protein
MPDLIALRLDSIRRVVPSDTALADALAIAPEEIERVRAGARLNDDALQRLFVLDATIELLLLVLEPTSAWRWLRGVNAHLDNRQPLAAIRRGDGDDVLRVAAAVGSGSYA